MLVWSMCEWSDFNDSEMCECQFGQCVSGPVFTTSECASASLVNVRAVRLQCASEHGMCECEYSDVRVIGYVRVEMCE